MLIHKTKNNTYWFQRENWKEWFRFYSNGNFYLKFPNLPRLKWYKLTYNLVDRDIDIYWFIIFVPFVKIGLWIKRKWFNLGKWFWKKGLLGKYKEGERISWFWLKYLTIKKCPKK